MKHSTAPGPERNDNSVRAAWENRLSSNSAQQHYVEILQKYLDEDGTRSDVDHVANISSSSDDRLYLRTLVKDSCNAIIHDQNSHHSLKLTLFFIVLKFNARKRQRNATKTVEALEKCLARHPLCDDKSKVFISAKGYDNHTIARFTPRDGYRLLQNCTRALPKRSRQTSIKYMLGSWMSAQLYKPTDIQIHIGLRVSPHAQNTDDYFDRLNPMEFIHSLHGSEQPTANRNLAAWRDDTTDSLRKTADIAMFSWPCDRDDAVEISTTTEYTSLMNLERIANGFREDDTIDVHVSASAEHIDVLETQDNRIAGPIRLQSSLIGWPVSKAIKAIAGHRDVITHDDPTTFLKSTDQIKRH
jgi:hypothetical protein